jgi:4-amino-4-deoxy-L-arabinose transferase-like glycosyltransferase
MRAQRAPVAIEALGLALILLTAGVLRLGWVGVHSFGYDEARISLSALQMARGGQFARVGMPSSTGVPNPPGFVWLMALPFALSPDPLVASLFIGALGVLTTLGVWYLARHAWGPWSALAAGLLMASSPFAVFYSRSIWSQDLMAPLAVLGAWLAVAGVRRASGPLLAAHLFIAGFAWQVHYSGIVLLPASVWLVLRYRLWRRWPWLLAGIGAATLALAPFAYTLLRDAPDVLLALGSLGGDGARFQAAALLRWAEVGLGTNWDWLPLGWAWVWPGPLSWAQPVAQIITGVLIAIGLTGLAWHAGRKRQEPSSEAAILSALVPVWALATPLVFILSSTPIYHQYQLAALPAHLLGAAATGALLAERWRWSGPVVAGFALVVALTQGAATAMSLEANRHVLQPGGLGTPLHYPRAAMDRLRDGAPVYVHAGSDDPAYDADAAGMSVLLWGYPHRLVDGHSALLLPPDGAGAHLFFLFPDLPALEHASAYARIEASRPMPRRHGEPPYLALTVQGHPPQGLRPLTPIMLENGAALHGWDATWSDGELTLITCWRITGALQPGRYHQFNHLYAIDGDAPLQVVDRPISSMSWQAGDTLITWATFVPDGPGPYRFEVGMYTYPGLERVAVPDAAPDDPGAIRLGPPE